MPGDTKIKRAPGRQSGWVDVDNPNAIFSARWQARAARRNRLAGYSQLPAVAVPAVPVSTPTPGLPPVPQTAPQDTLTSLQHRLIDRMTGRQGVSLDDALEVVKSNGYNKAASYGHMREAGANHFEATVVINFELPDVSLAYGIARAAGKSHTDALTEALFYGGND